MNRRITAAVAVAILLTGSCKQPTADDENNTTAKTETMTVKDTDITPNEILQTIQGYYGGSYISNFNRFSRLYNVTMQAEPDKRVAAESLSQVFALSQRQDGSSDTVRASHHDHWSAVACPLQHVRVYQCILPRTSLVHHLPVAARESDAKEADDAKKIASSG